MRYRDLVLNIVERKIENLSFGNQRLYGLICVLNPDLLVPEMKNRALAFVRQVFEDPQAAPSPYLFLLRGAGEYREGRFTEAIDSLGQAAFAPQDTVAQAWAVTYKALAYKRLGRAKEAAQATQDANGLFARQTSRNAHWRQMAFYQLAMKELLELLSSPEEHSKITPAK